MSSDTTAAAATLQTLTPEEVRQHLAELERVVANLEKTFREEMAKINKQMTDWVDQTRDDALVKIMKLVDQVDKTAT